MRKKKDRYSTVSEFNVFTLKNVKQIYAFESRESKNITIGKSYSVSDKEKPSWDGTYELEYGNVTTLRCYIDFMCSYPVIEFIEGESIHGSSSEYELDKHDDIEVIYGIINQVENDQEFIDFCRAKNYLNCLDQQQTEQLTSRYGNEVMNGYLVSCLSDGLEVINSCDEFDFSRETVKNLAYDNYKTVFDSHNGCFYVGNSVIHGPDLERFLDEIKGPERKDSMVTVTVDNARIIDGFIKKNPDIAEKFADKSDSYNQYSKHDIFEMEMG